MIEEQGIEVAPSDETCRRIRWRDILGVKETNPWSSYFECEIGICAKDFERLSPTPPNRDELKNMRIRIDDSVPTGSLKISQVFPFD